MSTSSPDNRMAIFRFIDTEFPEEFPIQERYILASEKYITGHITLLSPSGKERISMRLWQIEKDRDGLYKYIIKFSYGTEISNTEKRNEERQKRLLQFHENGEFSKPLKRVQGYRFHGSYIDEVCCLLSLRFQARFYLLFKFDDYTKFDFDWNFFPVRSAYHPTIFDKGDTRENNFNHHFEPFLEKIKSLDSDIHQKIAFSSYFYREALHSIGVNNNIVYTHLVSAIEALIDTNRNKELSDKLKTAITDFSNEEKSTILNAVGHTGVKKAFVDFVIENSKSWDNFKKETDPEWHLKVLNEGSGIYALPEVLKRVYNSRSSYLHEGIPMFIQRNANDGQHFSLGGGAIIDNVSYLEEDKLPYAHIFEDIIRFSILNFIQK